MTNFNIESFDDNKRSSALKMPLLNIKKSLSSRMCLESCLKSEDHTYLNMKTTSDLIMCRMMSDI